MHIVPTLYRHRYTYVATLYRLSELCIASVAFLLGYYKEEYIDACNIVWCVCHCCHTIVHGACAHLSTLQNVSLS